MGRLTRRWLAPVLLVLVATAGCTAAVPSGSTATSEPAVPPVGASERLPVEVIEVVDGDTVDVRLPSGESDTVRLVGIDTPEVHAENDPSEYEGVPGTQAGAACLGEAGRNATEYAATRLSGATVAIAADPETDRRGGYGRLLAYVYADGETLNRDLVASGHARVYDTAFTRREAFLEAERAAREANRGLWTCRGS